MDMIPNRKLGWIACVVLLAFHGVLTFDALRQHNLTVDEPGHLLSGLIAWEYGRVDVYPVNPPLIKLLAAFPWLFADPRLPEELRYTPSSRWIEQSNQFLQANRERLQDLTIRARCTIVALSICGGFLIYRWSSQLFGTAAGLVGVALWSFCPNVLTWAGIASVDMGAAVFGLAAIYTFRSYIHHPGWLTALWTGWVFGLALSAKFTLLVFYPVFLILWLIAWRQNRGSPNRAGTALRWHHLALVFFTPILVINMGYAFQGTGRTLGSFSFRCHALTREDEGRRINRFQGTWLKHLPIPLPAAYLEGLDEQKSHADMAFPAYLRGQWRQGGWWYYYLYGLGVKLPLGTLAAIVLCLVLLLCGSHYRRGVLEELLIWLPAAAIFVLISSQTGINSHLRYVLPMFPFLFIGVSRIGLLLANLGKLLQQRRLMRLLGAALVLVALGWNAIAVARIHPHYLSYFNEIAGGPENGWQHLVDSNIDWGQDLLLLKRWTEEHPEVQPLHAALFAGINPHLTGLDYELAPFGNSSNKELRPGWYAVSVNLVCGMRWVGRDEHDRRVPFPPDAFSYFRHISPVEKTGYSIFIYRINLQDANRFRREWSLPLLADTDSSTEKKP